MYVVVLILFTLPVWDNCRDDVTLFDVSLTSKKLAVICRLVSPYLVQGSCLTGGADAIDGSL